MVLSIIRWQALRIWEAGAFGEPHVEKVPPGNLKVGNHRREAGGKERQWW